MIGIPRDPEFSDRPFVAGSLTGVRCWSLDTWGRLGPMNSFPDSVWRPDENEAKCHRQWCVDQEERYYGAVPTINYPGGTVTGSASLATFVQSMTVAGYDPLRPPRNRVQVPEHPVATLECVCGFYAYFDTAHNPHADEGGIFGLIEGYGLVTVGARGFRASKARIKALVMPADGRPALWLRVIQNYNGIPIFDDIHQAIAQFPLTLPDDVPNPGNTPDFWTRTV